MALALCLLSFTAFVACSDDDDEVTPVINVTASPFSLDGTTTIEVPFTVSPADYAVSMTNMVIDIDSVHQSSMGDISSTLVWPDFSIVKVTPSTTEGSYVAEVQVTIDVPEGMLFDATYGLVFKLDEYYDSNRWLLSIYVDNTGDPTDDTAE